jgi:hypothetical protein
MNATSTLRPRASSPSSVDGSVGEDVALLRRGLPDFHQGTLVMQVFWFER